MELQCTTAAEDFGTGNRATISEALAANAARRHPWYELFSRLSSESQQFLAISSELLNEHRHFVGMHTDCPRRLLTGYFYLQNGGAEIFSGKNSIRTEACEYLLWEVGRASEFHTLDEPKMSAEAISYHEAGHAVIAKSLGRAVESIRILENWGEARINVAEQSEWSALSEREAREELLIAQAGVAAQCRFLGLPTAWAPLSTKDCRIAKGVSSPHDLKYCEFHLIDKVIESSWLKIETVASRLCAQNTLNSSEILGLLHKYDETASIKT